MNTLVQTTIDNKFNTKWRKILNWQSFRQKNRKPKKKQIEKIEKVGKKIGYIAIELATFKYPKRSAQSLKTSESDRISM